MARVAKELGLDRPVYVQYGYFLKRLVVDQSLGRSYANRRDVNKMIREAVPATTSLVIGGAILWMLIALPIGILSALRPRSLLDRGAMIFVLSGSRARRLDRRAAPVLRRLQVGADAERRLLRPRQPLRGRDLRRSRGLGHHMILPWITFAILFAASYARMIRSNMMDTLGEDYVRTARAKGAPETIVIRRHVLRNALLPVVTMLGLDIGIALGGAMFTETIFGLPGLGRLAINSVLNFDLPTLQGVVVFATFAIIVFNLIVDLIYAVIDPRIRLA